MKLVNVKVLLCAIGTAAALSACSTQQASSRYATETQNSGAYACVEVVQSCGYYVIPTYHQYLVRDFELAPTLPPAPPQPEPPIVLPPMPEPEVLPPQTLPPVSLPPEPKQPMVPQGRPSCPEGSIPGYGGGDCIPITIPRK